MSLSIISSVIRHSSGHLARRPKPQQIIGFNKSLIHHSSFGRSFPVSPKLSIVSWKTPHMLLADELGSRTHSIIGVYSCRLHYSTSSSRFSSSLIKTNTNTQGLLLQDLNSLRFPTAGQSLLSDFPAALQKRFSSSQKRSRDVRVLSRKETQNLGKGVKNVRRSSEKAGEKPNAKESNGEATKEIPEEEEKQLTLYQRFKKTYKEHGKVLVGVHIATSIVWFGSFYTAASLGFDIVPLLESWNLSERVISPFRSGGLGNVALAYLFYKVATPARYTVTIAGTRYAIGWLQKEGRMKVVPKADSLRSLYNEGKEDIKGRSRKRISMIRRRARARRLQRNGTGQNGEKS